MPPFTEIADFQSPLFVSEQINLDFDFLSNPLWTQWERTGFKIKPQVLKLAQDYRSKIEAGKSPAAAIREWAQETAEDEEGFWHEYVCKRVILLIKAEKRLINGRWEIAVPCYGNKTLSEITSSEERNGAAKEAIEKVTSFLTSAPRGSTAIFISPTGWSGLRFEDGTPIEYPETQIYVYKINLFGQVEAITVRVSNSLSQNLQLYSLLAEGNRQPNFGHSLQEKIEGIVRNPILINGAESSVEFKSILQTIERVKNSNLVLDYYFRGESVQRTFEELWYQFNNRYHLCQLEENTDIGVDNEKTRQIINDFKKYMENYEFLDANSLEEIAYALDKTIRLLFRIKNPLPPRIVYLDPEIERRIEMTKIQQLPGCVGGSMFGNGNFLTFPGVNRSVGESVSNYVHCGKPGCPHAKDGSFKSGQPLCENAVSRN